MLARPGTYTVSMAKRINGVITDLSEPQQFDVMPLREGALPGASHDEVAAFMRAYEDATGSNSALDASISEATDLLAKMKIALSRIVSEGGMLESRVHDADQDLIALKTDIYGPSARQEPGERVNPTVGSRLFNLSIAVGTSTYGPTDTHKQQMAIVNTQLATFHERMVELNNKLENIKTALKSAGAPAIK